MADQRRQQGSGRDPALDSLDRLYAAPLEQFVPLRRQLAEGLRSSGDISAARRVKAAAKPTRTAWAINQIARRHAQQLRALFDARDAAAAAQRHGDGEQVRSTVRAYRERLADVVRVARDLLGAVGMELGVAQSRRVAESLQAASAGDEEVRGEVLAGRLVRDVDDEDPFMTLEVGPARARSPAKPEGPDAAAEKRDAAARAARERAIEHEREQLQRAIDKGRERVASLEQKQRETNALATEAEAAASRAKSAAERATRAVADAERELEQARASLRALGK